MYLKKQDSYTKIIFFFNNLRFIYCFSFDKYFLVEIKKYLSKYPGMYVMKAKKAQIIKNMKKIEQFNSLYLSGYFFICGTNSINEFLDFYFDIKLMKIKNEFLLFCIAIDKLYIKENYLLSLNLDKSLKKKKLFISFFKLISNIYYFCHTYLVFFKQFFAFLIETNFLKNYKIRTKIIH
jgi:hypothetical protein